MADNSSQISIETKTEKRLLNIALVTTTEKREKIIKLMKKNSNIFIPNYWLPIIGSLIILWFICLIIWYFYHDWGNLNIFQLTIPIIILIALIRIFFTFIDLWIDRIGNKKVFLKRPWSLKWKEENVEVFTDITLKVRYNYSTITSKKLIVYTNTKKKYIFRSYSNNLEEKVYLALLHQTALYGKYKSLIDKEKYKMKTYEKWNRFDWIIIILLLLGVLILKLL
jgi:hypothetical protein